MVLFWMEIGTSNNVEEEGASALLIARMLKSNGR